MTDAKDSLGRHQLNRLLAPPPLTAAEIARRIRSTPQAVSSWLRGVSKPLPHFRERLEKELGIPEADWDVPAPPAPKKTGKAA